MAQAVSNYDETILNEHHPLTSGECHTTGWWNLPDGAAYMSYQDGPNPAQFLLAKCVSPQENFDAGRFPIMSKIRNHFLDPDRQQALDDAQIGRHSESRGPKSPRSTLTVNTSPR